MSPVRPLRRPELAGLTALALASPTARAVEPITASVHVHADVPTVLRVLADHEAALRVCPDVRAVRVLRTLPGGCAELEVETTGFLSPMRYRSRRCPDGAGYTEALLSSDDFTENRFTWSVVDEGAARRVTLEVRSEPTLPVPGWIVAQAVRRSVDQTVAAFATRVDGAGPTGNE